MRIVALVRQKTTEFELRSVRFYLLARKWYCNKIYKELLVDESVCGRDVVSGYEVRRLHVACSYKAEETL